MGGFTSKSPAGSGAAHQRSAGALLPTVLIAETESLLRWAISEALRDRFRVLEADSFVSALEALATDGDNLALVILDQRLFGGSGLELLRQVRESQPSCRVVVMTSSREARLEAEVRGLGATLLFKPFDVSEIAAFADGRASDP